MERGNSSSTRLLLSYLSDCFPSGAKNWSTADSSVRLLVFCTVDQILGWLKNSTAKCIGPPKQSVKLPNGSSKHCCRAASPRLWFVVADIKWGVNYTIGQDILSCLSKFQIRNLSLKFHENLFFNRKFKKFQKTVENEEVENILKYFLNLRIRTFNSVEHTCKHWPVGCNSMTLALTAQSW